MGKQPLNISKLDRNSYIHRSKKFNDKNHKYNNAYKHENQFT